MIIDDILLLKLLKSGDKQAFKYIFDAYFSSLCRFMYLYLSNKQEAEEIAIDLFMYLWESRESLEIKISIKAYLFRAARNRCLNALRDRKSTLSLEDIEFRDLQMDEENRLEVEELGRLIEEAIFSLPSKCKDVFLKSRTENLTNQQIADEMNVSVKTVEAQMTKALKRIRDFLGEKYYYLF